MMLLEVHYNFLGLTAISFGAFLGAILTTFLVYNIAQVENKTPVVTLLLSGIAISFFLTALINLIMALNRDHLTNIVYWTMGSVSSASWAKIGITIIPVVIGIIIFMIFSRDLNIILLGEETAYNLGIEVEFVKKILLITASLVAAAVVSVSGIIGFVGLIIPHAMRLLVGPDHRRLIPFSILGGGLFMIVSDTIARTIVAPTELPIGVITALIGAPYFVFLLIKNKKVLN
jgi:iron complex transport system permease protein